MVNRYLIGGVALWLCAAATAQEARGISLVSREDILRERGARWAVLIGVDKYEDEVGIGSLKYCAQDMRLLYRVLTGPAGGYARERVLLMTTDGEDSACRPTFNNICRLLPLWLADAQPGDDVMVAFSGHGVMQNEEAYLLPSTARYADVRRTGIPLRWLREWMEACQAARKVLIVDACHSGSGRDVPRMHDRFWRELDLGHGFIKLASCGPDQKSNEDAALRSVVGQGHGVFTYYLAEGLTGRADYDGDGRVDVDEVYLHAYKKTRQWADTHGVRQDPVKSGTVTGLMTLCYYRDPLIPLAEGSPGATASPKAVAQDEEPRLAEVASAAGRANAPALDDLPIWVRDIIDPVEEPPPVSAKMVRMMKVILSPSASAPSARPPADVARSERPAAVYAEARAASASSAAASVFSASINWTPPPEIRCVPISKPKSRPSGPSSGSKPARKPLTLADALKPASPPPPQSQTVRLIPRIVPSAPRPSAPADAPSPRRVVHQEFQAPPRARVVPPPPITNVRAQAVRCVPASPCGR